MSLSIIAAQSRNGIIGNGLDIPWKVKGEQKLFKEITLGGCLIMGRKTFESIGRPLPGRNTIIVTRQQNFVVENCIIAKSIDKALETAATLGKETFIAGGGQIYAQTIALADHIHLSTIDMDVQGDVVFPSFPVSEYQLVEEKKFNSNIDYIYRHYQRSGLC